MPVFRVAISSTTLPYLYYATTSAATATTTTVAKAKKPPVPARSEKKKQTAPKLAPIKAATSSAPVPVRSPAEKAAMDFFNERTSCDGIKDELFTLCARYSFKHAATAPEDTKKRMAALSVVSKAADAIRRGGDALAPASGDGVQVWKEYTPKLEALYGRILEVSAFLTPASEKVLWSTCVDGLVPLELAKTAYQKEVIQSLCAKASTAGAGGVPYMDSIIADVILGLQAEVDALIMERGTRLQTL